MRAAEILCEPFHRVMRCVPGLEKRVGEAWQAARAGGATIHPGWAGIVAGPDGRFRPKLGSFARPPAPGHALRGCAEAP